MGVFVLITKYILGCCYHFTVGGTSFHSDNFYKTTLYICSQETAFLCFYGRNAVPLVLFFFHRSPKFNNVNI